MSVQTLRWDPSTLKPVGRATNADLHASKTTGFTVQGWDGGWNLVPDPLGSGLTVARVDISDSHIAPPTGAEVSHMARSINGKNPAVVGMLGAGQGAPGNVVYARTRFMVPPEPEFPAFPSAAIGKGAFAMPLEFHGSWKGQAVGSPITSLQFVTVNGQECLCLRRMGSLSHPVTGKVLVPGINGQPWVYPFQRGQDVDIAMGIGFDRTQGWYEFYENQGSLAQPNWVPVPFLDGSLRLSPTGPTHTVNGVQYTAGRTVNVDPITGRTQVLTLFSTMCYAMHGFPGHMASMYYSLASVSDSLAAL